jgi:hypothetical protein
MVVSMKNRREFLKIFGMVTAAGAALTTVGVVAKAAPGVIDASTCVKTPKLVETYHSPVKRFTNIEPKWLGGPKDDYYHWRNVWANLSGIETAEIKEAKERDDKIYARVQRLPIGPDMRQQLVDNVFKTSPLFEHFKRTSDPKVDHITVTAVDANTNRISSSSGTSFTYTYGGAYNKNWDTFTGNRE